jgi:hypothetical protein
MNKDKLLKIVGDELSANTYEKLLVFLSNPQIRFSDNLRIEIQEKARLVGTEISGSEFHQWLNSYVCNKLLI